MSDFAELEIDLLTEMFNVGVGKAAASLSAMMKQEILLNVPRVELLTGKQLAQQFGNDEPICCIRQVATGDFNFTSSLTFPEECSLEIVKLLLDSELDDTVLLELRPEAMTEIGNILLNACIGRMAKMMDVHFIFGLPEFLLQKPAELLAELNISEESSAHVLLVSMQMHLKESNVAGDLMFIFDASSFNGFHQHISKMLQDIQN